MIHLSTPRLARGWQFSYSTQLQKGLNPNLIKGLARGWLVTVTADTKGIKPNLIKGTETIVYLCHGPRSVVYHLFVLWMLLLYCLVCEVSCFTVTFK